LEKIKSAVVNIYEDWNYISTEAQAFIIDVLENKRNYDDISQEEISNKTLLIEFEEHYNKVLNSDNLENILAALQKKKLQEEND
jgi:hypothetical protein